MEVIGKCRKNTFKGKPGVKVEVSNGGELIHLDRRVIKDITKPTLLFDEKSVRTHIKNMISRA